MNHRPAQFTVVITDAAYIDLRSAAAYIAQDSPGNAVTWLRGVLRTISRLSLMPDRFGLARESPIDRIVMRQVVFKSHRVIYSVRQRDRTVTVHAVIHAARERWRPVD